MRAEQISDPVMFHGEGPVWWPSWGGLRCVDMLAGDVLTLRPDGTVARQNVGRVAAALRPRRGGGAVIAVERGFTLEDADGTLTHLPDLWDDAGIRMNDGGCDPHGRFYCGTMAYDQRAGAGTLYRLDADGKGSVVHEGVTISNGLEWSPDGTRAYYNDTPTNRVDVFDYDFTRGLVGRRTFVEVPGKFPDGLTVDAEGGVWIALFGEGEVRRYTPSGKLDEVIEVPARQVTACTFGGEFLTELYVTTSREGLKAGDDPLAGALFRVSVGVRGLPARTFGG
ncbi:SMP-30/gluconolactonase/LRE family protein [Deinococcus yavapaiensis]|uniref:Sugar lactone lactonase YvrE n=1 Tax=Deinococcus yavapaiensis KR-236 TaxID=694435 RepID=A0A318SB63_9DEIO|nr:SMP-30/gluconolactonase/LRE family protein [Deinococcus yavapaiensis]PYE55460.1 sugar lactone lactonase YvrE [Deinococcus yavapaiensis KR-236]